MIADWLNAQKAQHTEDWRHTPLDRLEERDKITTADYQFDIPYQAEEGDLAYVETLSLEHLDLSAFDLNHHPLAKNALAQLQGVECLTISEGASIDETIALAINGLGRNVQASAFLLKCEKNARASMWLDVRSMRHCYQLPVLLFDIAENASLDLVMIVASDEAFTGAQLALISMVQAKMSHARVNVVAASPFMRLDVRVQLNEEGASCAFGAIANTAQTSVSDWHISMVHKVAHTHSQQIVRGVLSAESKAMFDGHVLVENTAQGAQAEQNARFLLQSASAQAFAVPRLEIYHNDVQCKHGATTGRLDPEALFYLKSRGLNSDEASQLLIEAFLNEAVVVAGENQEIIRQMLAQEGENDESLEG